MPTDYSKYLLRLSELERQKLQLVVAALKVSEYTDDVDDVHRPHNKEARMVSAMMELFDTITGLSIASDAVPRSIKESLLAGDASIEAVVPLLEELFEILRRHKRLNPFSDRGEYGKLVMLLQDAQKASVRRQLGISSKLVIPLKTVGGALESVGASALLADGSLRSSFLHATGKEKTDGLARLVEKYGGTEQASRDVVERALRSIDDVRQFIKSNVEPLEYLQSMVTKFESVAGDSNLSLAIRSGKDGACFTHDHLTHCKYVRESLQLWILVQRRIFEIWSASEDDMLLDGGGQYNFCNTGQGFHRMCRAPKSYSTMARCVEDAERMLGGWVGIKVIHLGDRDVPNPLVFIDKYTIVPCIVQPVVHTVRALQQIFTESGTDSRRSGNSGDDSPSGSAVKRLHEPVYPGLGDLLRMKYHSCEKLQHLILADFFKHAFDGSGDDGGSCIDGRLTSAWNWCHQIEKKIFYDAFVLTGFNGFDS